MGFEDRQGKAELAVEVVKLDSIRKGAQGSETENMKSGRNDDERKVHKVAPIEKGGAPQGPVNKTPQVTPQVPAGECHLNKVGV